MAGAFGWHAQNERVMVRNVVDELFVQRRAEGCNRVAVCGLAPLFSDFVEPGTFEICRGHGRMEFHIRLEG